jgi:pyruvate, water dikinase
MNYVAWFKDLTKDSISIAGGKGANLGIMFKLGLPVPNGFCVTAQTYKLFVEQSGIQQKILQFTKQIDIDNTAELQRIAKIIQQLIIATPMPQDIVEEIQESYELLGVNTSNAHDLIESKDAFVAVRSSATAEDLPSASFAGQQATFLNVRGKDGVVNAVRECWASLFTARAIYYREKNKFEHSKVYISAIVQQMVDSEKSGIMFTINPATNNGKEIVIEAVYGLGEAIVSGSVNPNSFLVDKESNKITKHEIKKQDWGLFRDEKGNNVKRDISLEDQKTQIITDRQVLELARFGKKIETHYGKPQDIEWAIEHDTVMIVQSRAVTTFKPQEEKTAEEKKQDSTLNITAPIIIKGDTASKGVYSGPVRLIKDPSELERVQQGDVLVTTMTTPDMVPAMQRAGAIVTNEGGLTCHAAIVSREMGTPCIVGTVRATQVLKDDQIITVDATHGIVYRGKVSVLLDQEKKSSEQKKNVPQINTNTKVKVILDLPETAQKAADFGADGVGLVRLEIMIAQGGIHPAQYIRENKKREYIDLLKKGIGTIAKAFGNKPVWVRCSDMRSDEYRNLQGGDKEPHETDPMIGWHAIRRLLDEPEILKAEFTALKELQDVGITNVGVMIPFVIRTEEVVESKKIMREIGLEPCKDIEFGIMVETPAVCWIIEDICKEGISFVSFGTNDLTQLTLGIDRNNQKISKLFDEMHPAVLGEIANVMDVCQKYDVKTSICGQAGSKPEMAKFLVEHGIESISANRDALDEIRSVVSIAEKNQE